MTLTKHRSQSIRHLCNWSNWQRPYFYKAWRNHSKKKHKNSRNSLHCLKKWCKQSLLKPQYQCYQLTKQFWNNQPIWVWNRTGPQWTCSSMRMKAVSTHQITALIRLKQTDSHLGSLLGANGQHLFIRSNLSKSKSPQSKINHLNLLSKKYLRKLQRRCLKD